MLPWSTSVATRGAPFVTWTLIAINAILFLFEISLSQPALDAFLMENALVPARYAHPDWARAAGLDPSDPLPFLTNTFLHGGWAHVILNMWTLLIFGPALEDRMGGLRYLGFYLACGVAASVAHMLANPDSQIPALGASGAIAGLMGAFMRLFPLSRVIVVVPILFIPLFFEFHAFFFIGFWMAIQVFQGVLGIFGPNDMGGVAWWAHIGGFAAGWVTIRWISLDPSRYRPPQRDEGRHGFLPDGRRRYAKKGPWG